MPLPPRNLGAPPLEDRRRISPAEPVSLPREGRGAVPGQSSSPREGWIGCQRRADLSDLRPGQSNVRRTLLNGLTRCQRESSFGVGELCDLLLLARLRKPSGASPILRVGPHVPRDRPKAPVRKNW